MNSADLAGAVCATVSLASIAYWLLSTAWLRTFFDRARGSGDAGKSQMDEAPPVTFFRPLKQGVVDLQGKLYQFVEEVRESDQLLFGVDAGTDEARLCEDLVRAFPAKDLRIIECACGEALNPKISKLLQMAPVAKHEHWILLDSEFVAEAGWLERFRREWASSGKDAFTAGYRFTGIQTFLQALDAAPVLLTLWPGLGAVVRGGHFNLMLGAVIAVRRSDMDMLGGWKRFSADLAEDNRLGVALVRAGRTVGLSQAVATLTSDLLNWRDYWRHQCRIAITYRVCNPAGFAGMIFTHGVSFAVVFVLLNPGAPLVWFLLGAVLVCRWWTVSRLSELLQFPLPKAWLIATVASMVETLCWLRAWLVASVWWAGREWHVRQDGTLEK